MERSGELFGGSACLAELDGAVAGDLGAVELEKDILLLQDLNKKRYGR